MKKIIVVACMLALVACGKGKSVENGTDSSYNLTLIAETPEKVKVYKVTHNGFTVLHVATTQDGKQVSIAQH